MISTVSINENELNFDFTIFPNPTEQNINIKANEITEITIIDLFGKIVYQSTNTSSVNNQVIDISFLNSGIYFMQVLNSRNQTCIRKIIKN